MKNLYLTGLTVAALLMAVSVSHAAVLSEDVTYWYVNDIRVVKVQQTVYDQAETLAILQGNGNTNAPAGFLYAYSVSNLNVGNPANAADLGITEFAVNWATAPTYVTTSSQTLPQWQWDTASGAQPAWKWTGAPIRGITPGETVGGFWAVSNIGVDGTVNASVGHTIDPFSHETLTGKTTGPFVPDPPTFMTLAAGLLGMGLTRRFRRK